MRLFAKELFANKGQKMEVSEWSDFTQLNHYFQYLKFRGGKFYALDSKTLYSTTDWSSWTNKGSITTEYNVGEFDIWSDYALALVDVRTDGVQYFKSYCLNTGTTWGSIVNFPTSSKWANCHITNVRKTSGGFMLVGFKTQNNTKKGIVATYYRGSSSWTLSDPTELETETLSNFVYINHEIIKTTGSYTYTVNDDKRIFVGKNGYIVVGSYMQDASDFAVNKIGTYDWKNIEYGNDIIIVTADNGYMTVSYDYGDTWTTPQKSAEINIDGITFAYNRFYVTSTGTETIDETLYNYSYTNATYNGKLFRPLKKRGAVFGTYNQICYGNGKIYILNNGNGVCKVSYKTYNPEEE